MIYIPGGPDGGNEQAAEALGALLDDIPVTTFVETRLGSGSMTKTDYTEQRKELWLESLFFTPRRCSFANIILYDDAMKSGETLDYVADFFDNYNKEKEIKAQVIALVPTLWRQAGVAEVKFQEIAV